MQTAYRADIDGLRAVAVVPVVFYHAGIEWFSGGYVGVDVFFVISGYLITSIILPDIREGQFSLREFYLRRIRRLFPALFAMAAATTVAMCLVLMPWELEDFGQSLATMAVFASNIMFWSESGYFAGPAELKPLLHTWSLAIEEQYYLLFPGFLLLLARYGSARYLRGTLILLAVSLALSVWALPRYPEATFFLLPSRTWELMLGSALAMFTLGHRLSKPGSELLGIAGLALILTAVFAYAPETPFPAAAALLPCLGTAALIESGRVHSTFVARILSLRAIVFTGLISYSLYLWHWPLIVFVKHLVLRPLTGPEIAAVVAGAFLTAVLSWRFIEKPFRGSRSRISDRGAFQFAAVCMLTAIAAGLLFDTTEGLPSRIPAEVARIADVANDKAPERKQCEGISPAAISYERLCRINDLDVAPDFLVWGDSHAAALMRAVRTASVNAGRNGLNATSNGCAPLKDVGRDYGKLRTECVEYADAVLEVLNAHPEIGTVILAARWARHAEGTPFGAESRGILFLRDTQRVATTVEENREIFADGLKRTLDALAAAGRKVYIIGPVPEMGSDLPNVLAKARWRGLEPDLDIPLATVQARQAFTTRTLQQLATAHQASYSDLLPAFCDAHTCRATLDGLPLYFDDNHPASSGADLTISTFTRIFSHVQSLHTIPD